MKKILLTLIAVLSASFMYADEVSFSWSSADDWALDENTQAFYRSSNGVLFSAVKGEGINQPTVNKSSNDLRAYANNVLTVEASAESKLNKIVFTLSAQGKRRLTSITPSVGSVDINVEEGIVTWTGEASSVALTVGEKAIYGTDGESKAGQFCVSSPVAITGTIVGEVEEPGTSVSMVYTFTKITAMDQLKADGKYLLGANVEGVIKVAQNLGATQKYGYLKAEDATETDGKITANTLANTFTLKGSNIIDSYGRLMYQTGSYDSFNAAADASEGIDWSLAFNSDATVVITNDDVNKTVQYDTQYNSYGSYADVRGIYPAIYLLTDSAEDNTTPDEEEDEPAKIERITVKEFLEKADTQNTYELTGIVTGIKSTVYGNFTLEQDGAEIYIYGTLDKEGKTKNWESLGVVEGDSIVIQGVYTTYNDSPQIKNAQYISHKAMGADIVDISNTPETAYTVAEAKELVAAGEGLSTKVYVKGIISRIVEVSTKYGNANYYISEDGTENDEMQIYRGNSLNGEKFKAENEINVGDQVIIYGQLDSYKGNAQMAAGSSIYSITHGTSIDQIAQSGKNAEIYNLAGQRISKLQKGINIINGKKIIMK